MSKPFKNLGKVSKAHGLLGFFFFKLPGNLKKGAKLYLGQTEDKLTQVTLESVKLHKKRTLIKLSCAHDRTALEAFLGHSLWSEEEGTAQETESSNPEFEAYLKQNVLDSEGLSLGTCTGFYDCGAGPVIVIQGKGDLCLELPFNETYFKDQATLETQFPKNFFEELWQKV